MHEKTNLQQKWLNSRKFLSKRTFFLQLLSNNKTTIFVRDPKTQNREKEYQETLKTSKGRHNEEKHETKTPKKRGFKNQRPYFVFKKN